MAAAAGVFGPRRLDLHAFSVSWKGRGLKLCVSREKKYHRLMLIAFTSGLRLYCPRLSHLHPAAMLFLSALAVPVLFPEQFIYHRLKKTEKNFIIMLLISLSFFVCLFVYFATGNVKSKFLPVAFSNRRRKMIKIPQSREGVRECVVGWVWQVARLWPMLTSDVSVRGT